MNSDERQELAAFARTVVYTCENTTGFEVQAAESVKALRDYLHHLGDMGGDCHPQPMPEAGGEKAHIDPQHWQAQHELSHRVQKAQLHDLDERLTDITERLDRTLRNLAVRQPLPEPSDEEAGIDPVAESTVPPPSSSTMSFTW